MVAKNHPLPEKLRDDAIVEAVFEIRFSTTTLAEVLIGRLVEHPAWKGAQQRRLPAADMPASFRDANPTLRIQALIELLPPGDGLAIRIGPHVVSLHRKGRYVGWKQFQPELDGLVEALYSHSEGLSIERLGLRYMNALTSTRHGITSITDLDLSAQVANNVLSGAMNLNYAVQHGTDTTCIVRIATPDFLQGVVPENTTVYVDVDVFSDAKFGDEKEVKKWLKTAHMVEKSEFFQLLTAATIDALKEDQ